MGIRLVLARVLSGACGADARADGCRRFTLGGALQRLGRLKRLYRLKAFFFLLLMNAAGTMTYGETAWQQVTTPMAAALFLIGMAFFFASHLYLGWKRLQRK